MKSTTFNAMGLEQQALLLKSHHLNDKEERLLPRRCQRLQATWSKKQVSHCDSICAETRPYYSRAWSTSTSYGMCEQDYVAALAWWHCQSFPCSLYTLSRVMLRLIPNSKSIVPWLPFRESKSMRVTSLIFGFFSFSEIVSEYPACMTEEIWQQNHLIHHMYLSPLDFDSTTTHIPVFILAVLTVTEALTSPAASTPKFALVTGGSRGIGRTTCLLLAEKG